MKKSTKELEVIYKGVLEGSDTPIGMNSSSNLPSSGACKFNIDDFNFLQKYKETLNPKEAASFVGWDRRKLSSRMADSGISQEMEEIAKNFKMAIRLDAKSAAANYVEDYYAAKKTFHEGDASVKSKMLSGMAKYAELGLRATGHFSNSESTDNTKVVINFSIGEEAMMSLEARRNGVYLKDESSLIEGIGKTVEISEEPDAN